MRGRGRQLIFAEESLRASIPSSLLRWICGTVVSSTDLSSATVLHLENQHSARFLKLLGLDKPRERT
jgi:hypothetical protein